MAKKTVASFPAEFFDIWELALENKLSLEFPTRGQATNFKQQLYIFRRRMIEENPAEGQRLYQTDINVTPDPGGLFILHAYLPSWKRQVRVQREHINPLGVNPPATPTKPAGSLDEALRQMGFIPEGNPLKGD